MLGHLAVLSRAHLLFGLDQISSLGILNAHALNGLGVKSSVYQLFGDDQIVGAITGF